MSRGSISGMKRTQVASVGQMPRACHSWCCSCCCSCCCCCCCCRRRRRKTRDFVDSKGWQAVDDRYGNQHYYNHFSGDNSRRHPPSYSAEFAEQSGDPTTHGSSETATEGATAEATAEATAGDAAGATAGDAAEVQQEMQQQSQNRQRQKTIRVQTRLQPP